MASDTYRSRARMVAREGRVGETVVTWDGPVTIHNEGSMVVTDPDNAGVTVVNADVFAEEWSVDSPRITSISKTDKGYTVFYEDDTNAWYSDAQFQSFCNGFDVAVTINVTKPLTQTIGSMVGSGQTTIV